MSHANSSPFEINAGHGNDKKNLLSILETKIKNEEAAGIDSCGNPCSGLKSKLAMRDLKKAVSYGNMSLNNENVESLIVAEDKKNSRLKLRIMYEMPLASILFMVVIYHLMATQESSLVTASLLAFFTVSLLTYLVYSYKSMIGRLINIGDDRRLLNAVTYDPKSTTENSFSDRWIRVIEADKRDIKSFDLLIICTLMNIEIAMKINEAKT